MKRDGILRRQVRSWYGLAGEVVIGDGNWHQVTVGRLPLPHPPVVNSFVRAGLPRQEMLELSYLHEFGHFQTLPLAVGLAAWLARPVRGAGHAIFVKRFGRLVAGALVHTAAWELAAEGYVLGSRRADYLATYRRHHNRALVAFWSVGVALTCLGLFLVSRRSRRIER